MSNMIRTALAKSTVKCPGCKKPFFLTNPYAVYAEVWLGKQVSNYVYCGQKCFDMVMQKAISCPQGDGINTIEIASVTRVGETPKKYLVICNLVQVKAMLF